MVYGVLFERINDPHFPPGFYYAHIPALGLTTHGKCIEGARDAAKDLIALWITEKRAQGEVFNAPSEFLYSTLEISEDAIRSA